MGERDETLRLRMGRVGRTGASGTCHGRHDRLRPGLLRARRCSRVVTASAVLSAAALVGCSSSGGATSSANAGAGGSAGPATAKVADLDSITDLCSVYSLAEASAAVGVKLQRQPEGSNKGNKVCFYTTHKITEPVVELHLVTSTAVPTLVDRMAKEPGVKPVAGLGRAAYASQFSVTVELDDHHYLSASTGLIKHDVARDEKIAAIVVHRLGF